MSKKPKRYRMTEVQRQGRQALYSVWDWEASTYIDSSRDRSAMQRLARKLNVQDRRAQL